MAAEDFVLSDGRSGKGWRFTLDGGAGAIRRSTVPGGGDRFAIDIRSENKIIGEFDEQRNWKNGQGREYLSDSPDGYFDGSNVWTVSKNMLYNSLQWKFAKGLRSADFSMPGNMAWQPIYPGAANSHILRYCSIAFVAGSIGGANYAADMAMVWLRRIGSPKGNFTLEICQNSAGIPGIILKTVTKTIADVTDTISVLMECDWTTTTTLTNGTTYHIKVYGDATDDANNHWEVGVDAVGASSKVSSNNYSTSSTATFSLYYRVVDADIPRRLYGFVYNGSMYAVSRNDDGSASVLYANGDRGKATTGAASTLTNTNKSWVANGWAGAKVKIIAGAGNGQVRTIASNTTTVLTVSDPWNRTPTSTSEYMIYYTDRFTVIGSTGLGVVSAKPVVFNDIVYFPQESGTVVRRMRYNPAATPPAYEFADDGTNQASSFCVANDGAAGPVIWRALAGGVGRSPAKAWGTALVFTAVTLGTNTDYNGINGMAWHESKFYAVKDDQAWSVSGITPTLENLGLKDTPSVLNGRAIASDGKMLYFSRLHSMMRVFGGSADDVGLSWRGTGLAEARQGSISCLEPAIGWMFCGIDGGRTKTSSVHIYDGLSWHEFLDAYVAGKRIRDLKWYPQEDSYNRLWIDIGVDMIYVDFPAYTNNPFYDSTVNYQHESVIVSSTIDMGTSARLPKFIKSMVAVTKNLGAGKYIGVDYQTDDSIGTGTWVPANAFMGSPEEEVMLNIGNIRKFRYRLRLNTNAATTPIVLYSIVPNGFSRVPYKIAWNVRVRAGELSQFGGGSSKNPEDMLKWLDEMSSYPGRLRLTSTKYPFMNDYFVIVSPPTVAPERPQNAQADWQGSIPLSIMEV